jgi:putative heme-binding domain-containing protein
LANDDPQWALEAFWTWTSIAPEIASVSDSDWSQLLESPNDAIRRWSVRWIGDLRCLGQPGISADLAHQLDGLAETEPSLQVRQQLACTARRLEASIAMPIINANINRSIDLQDPFMPLLWWWSVERHCIDGNEEVLKRFLRPTLWKSELGRDRLLGLLVRRFAAEDSTLEAKSIAHKSLICLLNACPTPQERLKLWNFIDEGFQLRPTTDPAVEDSKAAVAYTTLREMLMEDLKHHPSNLPLLRAAMRIDVSQASSACRLAMSQLDPNDATIAGYIDALAIRPRDTDTKAIKAILDQTKTPEVTLSAAKYLAKLDLEEANEKLIEFTASYHSLQTKDSLIGLLLGRRKSALQLLQRIDSGVFPPAIISLERVRSLVEFDDSQIDQLISKHWGRFRSSTPEEKLAEVRRLNNDLRAGIGDLKRGKQIFQDHCASCHKLFGQGKELGPDLTSANRKDRDFLLVSIVDPSSVIRREYVSISVETKDGRILTGLVKSQEDGKISLQPQQGESLELSPDEIEKIKISEVSLMPEDLYRKWSEQDLRDLFAYLQSDQ